MKNPNRKGKYIVRTEDHLNKPMAQIKRPSVKIGDKVFPQETRKISNNLN